MSYPGQLFLFPKKIPVLERCRYVFPFVDSCACTEEGSFSLGEIITINYPPAKACNCRDAMAKAIFGRLFNYIVAFLNGALAPDQHTNANLLHIGEQDKINQFRTHSGSFVKVSSDPLLKISLKVHYTPNH